MDTLIDIEKYWVDGNGKSWKIVNKFIAGEQY